MQRILMMPLPKGSFYFAADFHKECSLRQLKSISSPQSERVQKLHEYCLRSFHDLRNSPPGSVSHKAYHFICKITEKIHHHELFLKEIPRISAKEPKLNNNHAVSIFYPPSVTDPRTNFVSVLNTLKNYHQKYFFCSVLFLPLTLAFTVVPGIFSDV
jgi:hypothetical protein